MEVSVAAGVWVNGSGVRVRGSVGYSVMVGKTGMTVTPGVMVGILGAHKVCPTRIYVE